MPNDWGSVFKPPYELKIVSVSVINQADRSSLTPLIGTLCLHKYWVLFRDSECLPSNIERLRDLFIRERDTFQNALRNSRLLHYRISLLIMVPTRDWFILYFTTLIFVNEFEHLWVILWQQFIRILCSEESADWLKRNITYCSVCLSGLFNFIFQRSWNEMSGCWLPRRNAEWRDTTRI